MSKNFIKVSKRELRRLRHNAEMYKDWYHGTIPPNGIIVDRHDYITMINEIRRLRKLEYSSNCNHVAGCGCDD